MTKNGKFIEELFEGSTINTPSMLCVQDYLDALAWVEAVGGVIGTIARSDANAAVIANWVAQTAWVDFVARVPETRSNTSVCLKIVDKGVLALPADLQAEVPRRIAQLLDEEDVAKDIGAHRAAPPGLRIWTGATVERSDVEALMPWLDWAFAEAKRSIAKAA
jgi:phosphoserine aminotransferase